MAYTYTNRKGDTYILCKGTTKRGKPRYYFAREAKGEVLDEVPEGYEVRENVNGQVSIGKIRPKIIRDTEVQLVKDILARHPKGSEYRVDVKGKDILIFEPFGGGSDQLFEALSDFFPPLPRREEHIKEFRTKNAHYEPVLRFALIDAEKRHFELYRMGYTGMGGWRSVFSYGELSKLAEKAIPTLDTDQFFELHNL